MLQLAANIAVEAPMTPAVAKAECMLEQNSAEIQQMTSNHHIVKGDTNRCEKESKTLVKTLLLHHVESRTDAASIP